jgi:uncharacterized membrane protein YfcA
MTDTTVAEFVFLGALSFGVGVLGGLVGLALGTIRLPALLLLGIPAPMAAGTNIIVSTVAAAGGSLAHIRARRVNWHLVAVMGVPSIAGAFVGGLASEQAPEGVLEGAVGAFVLWQGIEFIFRSQLARINQATSAHAATPARLSAEAGIGLGIGLVGGAVGLILGSVRLPAIIRLLSIDPRMAAGTNLSIGFLLGVAGFIGHGLSGTVEVPLALVMSGTALAGSALGARLTGRLRPDALVHLIGFVLTGVGVLLLFNAITKI